MAHYAVYYVYDSKPQYLHIKYFKSWWSIGAVMKFNKIKNSNWHYIGVAKVNRKD